MQAHPVVDAVHVAVDTAQHVSALAVGVVDQHVEHRHPPQPDVVGVYQLDRVAGVVIGPQDREVAARTAIGRHQVDEVELRPGL